MPESISTNARLKAGGVRDQKKNKNRIKKNQRGSIKKI